MKKEVIHCDKCGEEVPNDALRGWQLSIIPGSGGTSTINYDLCTICKGWIVNAIRCNKNESNLTTQ